MIHGIGIDIVKVDRIRAAVEKWGERFLRRIFTGNEIAYSYQSKDPFRSLSVRFAAKEAFFKALSSGEALHFTEIEVQNRSDGKPFLTVTGKTADFLRNNSLNCVHLSLSHEKEYGVAFVVIEK